jgi:cytochrome b6-f complex iron-sulfur subunit
MERKQFIKSCSMACVGFIAMGGLLESCSSSNYFANTTLLENKIVLKKSEFTYEKQGKTKSRKYVIVKNEKLKFPICVYKIEESYSSLYLECTHKGCELIPQGDYLVCPCHGSEFSNNGQVLNPPAEDNLKTFITESDNENIYILL